MKPSRMLVSDDSPILYDVVNLYGFDIVNDCLQSYPIWNEGQREWLNGKIIDHFNYRQIAQETPQMFEFFLKRQMDESMPAINPVFEAIAKANEAGTTLDGWQSESVQNATQNGKQLFSATPQTQLSQQKNYATNITETEGDGRTHVNSHGRNQTLAALTSEWASSVNNALDLVFLALEPLFIQYWD